ncbi:MAG: glycosyltransferase family 39 protein [Alphaproteobacteria bacterium]|nr:glycosyltransferase family 39 protein [Alphaproteobacteria bacterium]
MLLVAAAALGLRMLGLDGRWLWFDELLSVNFANHGLFETLVTAARFDVHPPLYYLQLSMWMRFGQSDAYVALDSVLWSLVAIAFVAATAARLASRAAALAAALLLAAAPAAVLYSQQVRMYAFIMAWLAIALWAWQRVVERGRIADAIGAAAAVLVVVYSHGVGVVMASGVCMFPAIRLAGAGVRGRIGALAVGYGLIVVGSLPAIGFSGSRGVLHTLTPSLADVALTLREILFGWDSWLAAAPPAAATAVAAAISAFCLWSRASRAVFACTVLMPVGAVLAISYAMTPIWLTRTIVVFVPFVALSLALALDDVRAEWPRMSAAATATVVAALAAATIQQQLSHRNGDDFRPAADFVRAHARPGDAVYAGLGPYETWALLWYLGGPGWGTPLSFHDVNPAWRRMLDRIGEDWVRRLRLLPTQDAVRVGDLTVTSQFARPLEAEVARRLFVVRKLDLPEIRPEGRSLVDRVVLRQMTVELWARP